MCPRAQLLMADEGKIRTVDASTEGHDDIFEAGDKISQTGFKRFCRQQEAIVAQPLDPLLL